MAPSSNACSVAEFNGPYGPYQVSELVLQRIWLKQAFDTLELEDQWRRSIVVESPGRWNRLEGPDFLGASLIIDGQRVEGDVELHFSQGDWKAHGHDSDPAYNKVVLHVVYHPPRKNQRPATTREGDTVPCLALLPRLWYSLEEYAAEDSIVASTGMDLRPEVETLLERGVEERRQQLIDYAARRWAAKRRFAAQRVERLGWSAACHQSAMEILGYAKNRIPMLVIATRYPLISLLDGSVAVETLWEAGNGRWRLSGSRPANHPRLRLAQYLAWIEERPCWPELLRDFASRTLPAMLAAARPSEPFGSAAHRRAIRVGELATEMSDRLLAEQLAGTLFNTMVCDGFLPLAASLCSEELFPLWFHWRAGNGPAACSEALKQLQVLEARSLPMSNGWLQGILGARLAAPPAAEIADREARIAN